MKLRSERARDHSRSVELVSGKLGCERKLAKGQNTQHWKNLPYSVPHLEAVNKKRLGTQRWDEALVKCGCLGRIYLFIHLSTRPFLSTYYTKDSKFILGLYYYECLFLGHLWKTQETYTAFNEVWAFQRKVSWIIFPDCGKWITLISPSGFYIQWVKVAMVFLNDRF